MPTRTGDATADLLALLKEHCPDVAEETLARLAIGAAALEGAAQPGDAEQRLRWAKLTMGDLPGIKELVTAAKAPTEIIAALLEFIAGILDVVSALLLAIPDPYRALILAAYQILKTIVDDLLASGVYLYFDAPGLTSNLATLEDLGLATPDLPTWVAGDKPKPQPPPADGFMNWAHRFRQSFDDPGDARRPIFSDGAQLQAMFIVATAPQLPDLASLGPLFGKLFDTDAFSKAWEHFAEVFPEWPDDPDRARLGGRSVHPDWESWKLRDIEPLQQLEKIPELLKALLLNVDSIIDLLKKLIQAVRDKIQVLRDIIAILQQIIDALSALMATGLATLVVVTSDGVDGLYRAFLDAENRPNTDAEGNALTANAVMGVCMLAGTSEVLPVSAAPIWTLFGQGESMQEAFSGLEADFVGLADQAEAAAADTVALASEAWEGTEQGGDSPQGSGITGLFGEFTGTAEEKGKELTKAIGTSLELANELARGDFSSLVEQLERAMAEGAQLDPFVLAHIEATRRARSRANRSLAMSLGPRAPESR